MKSCFVWVEFGWEVKFASTDIYIVYEKGYHHSWCWLGLKFISRVDFGSSFVLSCHTYYSHYRRQRPAPTSGWAVLIWHNILLKSSKKIQSSSKTRLHQKWKYIYTHLHATFLESKHRNCDHTLNTMSKYNKLHKSEQTAPATEYLETRKDDREDARAIVSIWVVWGRPCRGSFLMLWWRHALTSSSGSVPCFLWPSANASTERKPILYTQIANIA